MFSWGLPCVRNLLGNCDSCKSSRVLTVGLLCSARQNKMKCSIYWSMTRQFVIVSIQSFSFQRLSQQQKDDVVTQSPRFTPHRWQLVGPHNPSSYLLLGNPSSSRYHPCSTETFRTKAWNGMKVVLLEITGCYTRQNPVVIVHKSRCSRRKEERFFFEGSEGNTGNKNKKSYKTPPQKKGNCMYRVQTAIYQVYSIVSCIE